MDKSEELPQGETIVHLPSDTYWKAREWEPGQMINHDAYFEEMLGVYSTSSHEKFQVLLTAVDILFWGTPEHWFDKLTAMALERNFKVRLFYGSNGPKFDVAWLLFERVYSLPERGV